MMHPSYSVPFQLSPLSARSSDSCVTRGGTKPRLAISSSSEGRDLKPLKSRRMSKTSEKSMNTWTHLKILQSSFVIPSWQYFEFNRFFLGGKPKNAVVSSQSNLKPTQFILWPCNFIIFHDSFIFFFGVIVGHVPLLFTWLGFSCAKSCHRKGSYIPCSRGPGLLSTFSGKIRFWWIFWCIFWFRFKSMHWILHKNWTHALFSTESFSSFCSSCNCKDM